MRPRISILPALLLAQYGFAAAGSPGADEGGPKVAVVEPRLEGAFDRGAGEQFAVRIRAGVERSRVGVVDATHAEACADEACFARIVEDTRATYVLRAVVTESDRDYQLQLELIDATGASVASVEDTCEICGVQEAADMLEAAATRLTASLRSGSGRASVRVESKPPGATVIVDGDEMGTTPTTLDLPAGEHTIELRKNGFASASRTLELESGMRTSSEMRLVPNETGGPNRRAKIAGGVLLGSGLAFIATGIALVAVDGREYKKRCEGSDVDADGDCRFVYRLKWPGAALLGVGGALSAVGITVLVVDARRGRASLRAAVTPSGLRLFGKF